MKLPVRLLLIALLTALLATVAWQGDIRVYAEEGEEAATAENVPPAAAEKKTFDDFISYLYDQMPPVQRDRISRNDFVTLTKAMQEAAVRQMEKAAAEARGEQAQQMQEMVQKMREQMAEQDYSEAIAKMEEMNLKAMIAAQPQFNPAMQDQPIADSLRASYDSMPEAIRERMSFEKFQQAQQAQLRAMGLEADATWGEMNEASQKMTDELLAKVKSGEEIDLGEFAKKFQAAMGESARSFSPPRPPVRMAAAPVAAVPQDTSPAAVARRMMEISPLVTVTMRRGHSLDGYLLPNETMGRNPAQFIGVRPANHGSTGIFTGVMVVRRSDIASITFFDDEVRELKDLSLSEFMRQYMLTDVPAA